MTHHVVMMSSGAGSAMAAKRVAGECGPGDHLTLLFADVNMEHPDNYRFLREAHAWIGGDLVTLTNDGRTIWDVFKAGRFLGNTRADLCSRVLKREPMREWLEANCDPAGTVVHLGFDWTEEHRFTRAIPHWAPWVVRAPLCEEPYIDKAEAMEAMAAEGLLPPLLTRQGFPHANCGGGCVKAGHKQFKKLLELDPATFHDWERREQEFRDFIGKDVAILRDRTGGITTPLPLSTLRERLGVAPSAYSDGDWGGCNCMTPTEDESSEVEVEVSVSVRMSSLPQPGRL